MRTAARVVGLGVLLAGTIALGDFVVNNDSLPGTKTDFTARPPAIPATKWFGAADYNALRDASVSLRTGLVAGKLHGMTCQASRPTTPADAPRFFWCRSSDNHILYYNGTSDLDLTTGGSSNGLKGPYEAATTAARNIIDLNTTNGQILIRDNATPLVSTSLELDNSSETKAYFYVQGDGGFQSFGAVGDFNFGAVANRYVQIANDTASTAMMPSQWSPFYVLRGTAWDVDDVLSRPVRSFWGLKPLSGNQVGAKTSWYAKLGGAADTEYLYFQYDGTDSKISVLNPSNGAQVFYGSSNGTVVSSRTFTSGLPSFATLSVNPPNHTGLDASQPIAAFVVLDATVTWAAGNHSTLAWAIVDQPTYAFAGASTITTAATFAITGPPTAGTNATITNPYALWVAAGKSQFDGAVASALDITGRHQLSNGSAPSCTPHANAGSGASCSVAGTDMGGVITFTVGTTSAAGEQFTIDHVDFPGGCSVVVTAQDANTAGFLSQNAADRRPYSQCTTASWKYFIGTVGPGDGNTYKLNYVVSGY